MNNGLIDFPEFELLETMLYFSDQGIPLLEKHLKRLNSSRDFFLQKFKAFEKFPSLKCLQESIAAAIKDFLLCEMKIDPLNLDTCQEDVASLAKFSGLMLSSSQTESFRLRVRMTVNFSGRCELNLSRELNPSNTFRNPPLVVLDNTSVHSDNIFLRHKTTFRDVYMQARERCGINPSLSEAPFDVIIFNERDEITETSIANIALQPEKEGRWITPPLSCGLLSGVQRSHLLSTGKIHESIITKKELIDAVKRGCLVKCFNAIRGEYLVRVHIQ